MAKKLDGILIEVNGGVVSYVQFNGKPVKAYHLFDWDDLLGDGAVPAAEVQAERWNR